MVNSRIRIALRTTSLSLALVSSSLFVQAQSGSVPATADEFLQERMVLLSDLQGLTARSKQLASPLARSAAETEIADAVWALDRNLAKDLLRDAYKLTFPEEAEQERLRKTPVGTPPQIPTQLRSTQMTLRRAVMRIASRENAFASELARTVAETLGPYEAHLSYASLARQAVLDGDYDAARRHILQSIDAEPTQITGPLEINQLASRDRAAADEIILAYLNKLASTPLAFQNQSRGRVTFALLGLIRPIEFLDGIPGVPPPGPAVMRAYVLYTLNTAASLSQAPATVAAAHTLLVGIYFQLNQYAPELKSQFMEIEQRTRKPGENFSIPTPREREADSKAKFDRQVENELDSDHPDAILIQRVIGRGDFAKARKLIDKLPEGAQKSELIEILTTQQAISLANKNDLPGALKLSESLARPASIGRVFPLIAAKCAAKNDSSCARAAVNQAVRQLKTADLTPFTPPPGVPASSMGTGNDFDLGLTTLGKLAAAVLPLQDELPLDVLGELVVTANLSKMDTGQGRAGFETSLFKKFAEKDSESTTAVAMQFQDSLRQVIALAAIDQWKVDRLIKAEAASRNNESGAKKK